MMPSSSLAQDQAGAYVQCQVSCPWMQKCFVLIAASLLNLAWRAKDNQRLKPKFASALLPASLGFRLSSSLKQLVFRPKLLTLFYSQPGSTWWGAGILELDS